MQLSDNFDGSTDPFEGDRTFSWRSLPVNALVTKATIRLTPAVASGGALFEEIITFNGNGQGDLGATKVTGSNFVELDFHHRRTLAAVAGTNIRGTTTASHDGANLQVDMGGIYLEINDKGAIKGGPGDVLFAVPPDGTLPGLTVSKFKLAPGTSGAVPNVTNVTIRSVPTNVSVRLGTMPPFWTRVGEMTQSETSPDFAPVLQAFLATAQVENGFYTIPLVLHSDAVTRLSAELEIEYLVEQSIGPVGVSDVVLVFDVGGRAKA
jgi:hypothetical protein